MTTTQPAAEWLRPYTRNAQTWLQAWVDREIDLDEESVRLHLGTLLKGVDSLGPLLDELVEKVIS